MAYKAVKEAADAMNMSFSRYVKEGPDPMAVAVLLEDAAAVFGVVMLHRRVSDSLCSLAIQSGMPLVPS